MKNNERIAEWRGLKPPTHELPSGNWVKIPAFMDVWSLQGSDGVEATGEEFTCSFFWHTADGKQAKLLSYDTNITLWHGPDGLLAEIEKRELVWPFIEDLYRIRKPDCSEANYNGEWAMITASPAQLAAALVKTIEEVSDEQS